MSENMISLYHTGFQICAGLAVFFLLLTVFLFFKFKIPALFSARSGRAMRKTIREIEENNARTGRLRNPQEMGMEGIRKGVTITYEEKKKTGTLSNRLSGKSRKLAQQEAAGAPPAEAYEDAGATDVLEKKERTAPIRFVIEKDIMLIHSDEVL